jgi:predicted nucleic acid-binding Zn ribbon protein
MVFFFIFTTLLSFLNIFIKAESELYIPYSDYKNPSLNSIHGTGNRTLDVIYREKCAQLCGEKTYSDFHCCEGNTLEEEKCQSFKRCQEILDNFQRYVISIALISYLCLMVITMVIVFIVYYCYTKDQNYKCKNAYSSAIIVLFAATIIPIIILQCYCWNKAISIEQFFGANFDKCFNIGKSLQSIDVIDEKPERRINKINNIQEKPEFNNNVDKFDENNIISQKSSQRSGNYMLKEDEKSPQENNI